MSYVQHTKCLPLKSYRPLASKAQPSVEMIVFMSATLGWILALVAVVMSEPWCMVHIPFLLGWGGLFAYCDWWLNYRLVCQTGDQCAIGLLVSIETVEMKDDWKDKFDTDLSINLLLPNTHLGVTQAEAEASTPFGHLIQASADVKARSDIIFTGESAKPEGADKTMNSAILHAEFEGSGVWIMYLASAAGLVATVALIALCMSVLGAAISIVLEFFVALVLGLFGFVLARMDSGDFADVNPDIGSLSPALGNGIGAADILYVQGTHVFDGGHQPDSTGWNEIHPIKNVAQIGTWKGDWRTAVDTRHPSLDAHCEALTQAIGQAQAPLTIAAQSEPRNSWVWHPLIDGCEGSASTPAPPQIR